MTAQPWRLKSVNQCKACPWRVETDPHEIPNGYSVKKHEGLAKTIAEPGSFRPTSHVMACHETQDAHCVGWLVNQLGPGNNIGLRLRMRSCTNARDITLRGEQHRTFQDTLPKRRRRKAKVEPK